MKSLFEQMGGTYSRVGDYLIANLLPPEGSKQPLGKYGRMRRSFLKEHHPVLYMNLLTSGKLYGHLAEIEQTCKERMERIRWNGCAAKTAFETRAEEIILHELVYAL